MERVTWRWPVEGLRLPDDGHGYDRFGLSADGVNFALGLTRFLYDRWFRVRHVGVEHIPRDGRAVLVANHSGTLPFDALMVWTDVVRHARRVPRAVMDYFVQELPFLSTVFTRAGGIGGSRGNMHAVLEDEALVLVFPEGVAGVGKRFGDRYQLQRWTVGHAEMAIRHRAPVVPLAVIGAEEQLPQIARIPVSLFGSPYIPVTGSPLPLPVRYHLHYGPPIVLHERWPDADDPDAVAAAAAEAGDAVQALIDAGLEARSGVFR